MRFALAWRSLTSFPSSSMRRILPPTADLKAAPPTKPMLTPIRKSFATRGPAIPWSYPRPLRPFCLQCLKRRSVLWLLPEEHWCWACLSRSACGVVGLLMAVFGFGMALWSLIRMAGESRPPF